MQVQGPQVDYQLHTIGWIAFQELSLTVCAEVFEQPIEAFNLTKDGGRDGAFVARGLTAKHGLIDGSVTLQCKHFSDSDASLTLGIVEDELEKAAILRARGLADNYILMSNGWVSGEQHARISTAFRAVGIQSVHVFDANWLTGEIRKSAHLRRLVPRVYGLGDLGYILDERATEQTRKVLLSIQHDLKTFVQTEAYYKSAKALEQYNFCMLTGEPASGKSVIAATLAMSAYDSDKMQTLKIKSADDFLLHWNPEDPRQFFWVDDVFGATQYQRGYSDEWSKVFKELGAALLQKAKVVFTSRDYIFGAAMRNIALSHFPLLRNANVVIDVKGIGPRERVQILYNHVKFGDQPKTFKTAIKPFLMAAATSDAFVPEVARRLGTELFTTSLQTAAEGVIHFVERRGEYLIETLQKLDRPTLNALLVIFMNGSAIEVPLDPASMALSDSLGVVDMSLPDLREQLETLNGSLVQVVPLKHVSSWTFRHPTIRDALSEIVASNPELIDVYLRGTATPELLEEVRCQGIVLVGARVILPRNRYDDFIERLNRLSLEQIVTFLTERADASFLHTFMGHRPRFADEICDQFDYDPSVIAPLLARLIELDLLDTASRATFVQAVEANSIETPSAAFLTDDHIGKILTASEREGIVVRIRDEVLPSLDRVIERWEEEFSAGEDPEQHFEPLIETLNIFENQFHGESRSVELISEAANNIDSVVERLWEDYHEPDYDDDRGGGRAAQVELGFDRDPFDDVDK